MIYAILVIFIIFVMSSVSKLSLRVKKLENIITESAINNLPEELENIDTHYSEVENFNDEKNDYQNINLIEKQDTFSTENDVDFIDSFIIWLREDWLLKLGALLLIISFAWFVRYAFVHDWITPLNRIYTGLGVGMALLVFGWSQVKQSLKYKISRGSVFVLLGSTTVLLTMFAAREIYNFFTPLSALIIMFITLLFVSILGVKYKIKILYFIGFILASIIPFLLNIDIPNYMNFFMYLSIISVGAILIDLKTNALEMSTTALVVFGLYSLPHLFRIISHSPRELVFFAHAMGILFIATSLIQLKKTHNEKANIIILFASSFLTLFWIIHAGGEFKTMVTALWMLIFIFAGLWAFQITQKKNILFTYLGVAVAFLAALTSMQFEGDTLTIAYALEIGVLAFVFYHAFDNIKIIKQTSLLLIVPVVFSLGNITSSKWNNDIFHSDFFVLFILGIITFIFGLFFAYYNKKHQDEKSDHAWLFIVVGSLYFYALMWLSLHATLPSDTATMISLVVYTIIGLITYFYGIFAEKEAYKKYGKIMLIIVLLRLFIIDVWNMELRERIITFFIVGILLMTTAFIKKNNKNENKIIH